MTHTISNFIPIATSQAGLCLSPSNWQETKVDSLSFYLDALLLKPGIELLKKIPSLHQYMGWSSSTTMILNASNLIAKEGIFTLISPYDGSKLKLSYAQLLEIIQHIQPHAVLLPPKIRQDSPQMEQYWNQAIIPFLAAEDCLSEKFHPLQGLYFYWKDSLSTKEFLNQIRPYSHLPQFVMGSLDLDRMRCLKTRGIKWMESDEPALIGMHGLVLSQGGIIDIKKKEFQLQFEPLDAHCNCPTCSQSFTKAYLHHLFLHTPLLCQRFLIQHNIYFIQQDRLSQIEVNSIDQQNLSL